MAATPSATVLQVGTAQQLVAVENHSNGSQSDVTYAASWATSNTSIAAVTATGSLSGLAPGISTITASVGTTNATVVVTVQATRTLASVNVIPAATLGVGATRQLMVIGTYSDQTEADVTNAAQWAISNPAVTTITANGLLTGLIPGSATATASVGAVNAGVPVTVAAVKVVVVNSPAASVQAAVTAACDGTALGMVMLPTGTINSDSVTLPANCILQGQGPANTVLQASGMQPQILYVNGSYVTIRGLKLDGKGTTQNVLLWHSGDYGLVDNVEITGTYSDGAPGFNYGDGITVADFASGAGTNQTTFHNLNIHDVGRNCIFIGEGDHNTILNLTCTNYGLIGVDVEPDGVWSAAYGTVLNSTFTGMAGAGPAVYVTAGAATTFYTRGWQVTGNTVTGAGDCVPNTACAAGTVGAITIAADLPVMANNVVTGSHGNGYAISGGNARVTGNVAENNGQGGLQNRGFAVNNSDGIYTLNSCLDTQANPTQGFCFGENSSVDDNNQYLNNAATHGVGPADDYFLGPHDQWSNSGTPLTP